MDGPEFCRVFGCDAMELERYITQGMPHSGDDVEDPDYIDNAQAASWLVANGHAMLNPDRVARTMSDAAHRLGISRGTLREWTKEPDFPGRQGYWPIAEIEEWDAARDKRINQHATASDSEERKEQERNGSRPLTIKERRDLLKLKKEQAEVIDAERVKRMLQRLGAYLVSELNTLAGRIESRLPAGIPEEQVCIMRDTTRQVVTECREIISEFEIWELDDEPSGESADGERQIPTY